jgi:hypothetical protein
LYWKRAANLCDGPDGRQDFVNSWTVLDVLQIEDLDTKVFVVAALRDVVFVTKIVFEKAGFQ